MPIKFEFSGFQSLIYILSAYRTSTEIFSLHCEQQDLPPVLKFLYISGEGCQLAHWGSRKETSLAL